MLKPLDSQHLSRPDITALFPVDRGAILSWMGKLITAYNPWIKPFGEWNILLDPAKVPLYYGDIRGLVMQKEYFRRDIAERTDADARALQDADWRYLSEALAAGLMPQTHRQRLSEVGLRSIPSSSPGKIEYYFKPADDLNDLIGDADLWSLDPKTASYVSVFDTRGLTYEERTKSKFDAESRFIRLAHLFSWETIVSSGHLVNIPEAPEGVNKQTRAQIARSAKLFGITFALKFAWRAMQLRPYARLLREPAIRARVIIEYGPMAEANLAILDEMAALPVHPWMAIADSVGLPGRNKTPWNSASPTLGIDKYLWPAVTGIADELSGGAPWDPVGSGGVNLGRIFEFARNMKLDLEHCRKDELLAIDAAGQLLGFTSGGVRPNIALYGSEFEPCFTDGQLMSKAISPLDMLFRPILPLQRHTIGDTRWVGDIQIVDRDTVAEWAKKSDTYVQVLSEDVPYAGDYAMSRFSASMLQPVTKWQGERRVVAANTIESVAAMFGLTEAAMKKEMLTNDPSRAVDWAPLIEVVNGEVQKMKAVAGDAHYVSEYTRTPGLTNITVPVDMHVKTLAAMQWGLVVSKETVRAQYIRDLELPTAAFDVSKKLREFITSLIGRRSST